MRVGIQVSIRDRIDLAADRAKALGCETAQIFSCNPRSWAAKPLDPAAADRLQEKLERFDIRPLVVHVTYLPNLSSPERAVRRKSIRRVIDEVKRAGRLGAGYFVTHLGHHMGSGLDAGLKSLSSAIDEILGACPPGLTLLLENTADGRGSVGGRFEHLAEIIDRVSDSDRVGLCLDTAHAFAAGYDLSTPEAVSRSLRELNRIVGLDRVKVVHANDSLLGLGSRRDRHQHVGQGHIGRAGLKALVAHPKLKPLPFILETPIKQEGDELRNIRALKRLRTAATARKRRTPARRDP